MASALLLLLLTLSPQALALEPGHSADADWRLRFAPDEVLYPAYVADPRRPTFSLTLVDTRESDIGAASDRRYGLRMGTRFGILQLAPDGAPAGGLQLAGEVGFLAQFDRENSSDNLGWDGLYGFHPFWRARPELALRVGNLGWKKEISMGLVLELGLIENIIEPDNSPDFGLHFALRKRY